MRLEHDKFDAWLASMDQCLEAFLREAPEEIRSKLDFSPGSLSVVEAWLLTKYEDTKAILEKTEERTLDFAARYVGETYRRNIGGTWAINLHDPKRAYFRIPLLRKEGEWESCPASLVTASLDRRTGSYIETILTNKLDPERRAANQAKLAALKELPLETKSQFSVRDDFEYWLFDMDDRLEWFFGVLPDAVRAQLDYSPGSLAILEKWFLSHFASMDAIRKPPERILLDGASRYVGETLRKCVGGKWTIELKNPKHVYFQVPVLRNPGQWEVCPVDLVTSSLDKRTGGQLTKVLNNLLSHVQPAKD